jgi:hypothetical protein
MIIRLKMRRVNDEMFVINTLSHIVGHGNYVRDEQDPCRYRIEPTANNWWARVEDGVLSVNGRYADEPTMQAVKRMLLFRCDGELKEVEVAE